MDIIRSVKENTLTSSVLPEMTLRLAEDLPYLGSLAFDLKGIAQVERYLFVHAENGVAQRLFIVQFEGFLPDNTHTYRWPTRTPMTLCEVDWQHNPYFFDNAENIRSDPGAESDHTTRFLQAKGLRIEDELMMSRFARIVGAARRHEVILFYLENVSATGHTMEEISEDGDIRPAYQSIADGLVARSLEIFELRYYRERV
ncbi:MAG: hypothetical protein ACK2T7_09550 [Anaerolineales bacterium]